MAQRKITPAPVPAPAITSAPDLSPEPPTRAPIILDGLVAVSLIPAAVEPRVLAVTGILSLVSLIRKAR